jgi:hypothetical protein
MTKRYENNKPDRIYKPVGFTEGLKIKSQTPLNWNLGFFYWIFFYWNFQKLYSTILEVVT